MIMMNEYEMKYEMKNGMNEYETCDCVSPECGHIYNSGYKT